MGEAKRRGSFDQRVQQAQAKRAALFSKRTKEQERPVIVVPRRSDREVAELMAMADRAARNQGIFIIRPFSLGIQNRFQ